MGYFDKLRIAAVVTAIVIGVAMISDMFLSFGWVSLLFSPEFVIPTFVVAYLLAPYIGKHITYK